MVAANAGGQRVLSSVNSVIRIFVLDFYSRIRNFVIRIDFRIGI